jgi:iron complex transport system substrate-binding protein
MICGVLVVCVLLISAFYVGYSVRDVDKPMLEISYPPSGIKVNESKVYVNGTTDADIVEVNGIRINVENGTFSTVVDLVEGMNTITITAIKGGHTTTTSVTIFHGDYPLTVIDGLGRKVTLINKPKRVVSLAPSNTEILFAIGAGSVVVGVTDYCDYPPEVEGIEKVGGFSTVNVEKVIGLSPDLVLARGGVQTEIIKNLETRGLTVIGLDTHTVYQVLQDIMLVGLVTGYLPEATKLVSDLKDKIDYIRDKTKNLDYRPRVYYEVWNDPLITGGPGSFTNDLILLAGGINIAANTSVKYPIISSEFVVASNPEIIITSTHNPAKPEDIVNRSGWSNIIAIKERKIYVIDADIVSRPGPRIVLGLEQFAKCIHPEMFPRAMNVIATKRTMLEDIYPDSMDKVICSCIAKSRTERCSRESHCGEIVFV